MPKNLTIFVFLLLLCFNSFAEEEGSAIFFPKAEVLNQYTTRIPFKLIDRLIVIEAELLNKKGNFIIDTGSETLILNKAHFKTHLPHYRKSRQTSGVNHIIDNPLEKRLSEFIINTLKLENKTSDIIDLSHIEKSKKMNLLGIIGYNILKDYEVFIDTYLNQITLTKVDSKGRKLDQKVYLEKITDSVSFKLKKHTIVLETYVNNHKVKFGLDTAAEYNQINKRSSKKVLKYFYPSGKLTLIGVSGNKTEVLAGKLFRVKLNDNIYFGPMETVLTNLNNMNEAFGTSLDGVLGHDFFRQKRTIINYQKQKLYFVNHPFIKQ